MDLPLVLEKLGYTKQTGINGDAFWGGTCATSNSTYEQMSGNWPNYNPPLSGKDVFEAAWLEVSGELEAEKYQAQRVEGVSGYSPLADQLDMLYWDIQSGVFGESAKGSQWFQDCSGVKTAYPKSS